MSPFSREKAVRRYTIERQTETERAEEKEGRKEGGCLRWLVVGATQVPISFLRRNNGLFPLLSSVRVNRAAIETRRMIVPFTNYFPWSFFILAATVGFDQ